MRIKSVQGISVVKVMRDRFKLIGEGEHKQWHQQQDQVNQTRNNNNTTSIFYWIQRFRSGFGLR